MKYRKKPVVINAIQWNGSNLFDVISFMDCAPNLRGMHVGEKWEDYCRLVDADGLKICTLEGKMSASVGDWIIRGVKDEYYPCKPDIFAATYDAVASDEADQ